MEPVRRANNVLKHAPHTADVVMAEAWDRPYSREKAAFPAAWVRNAKFWPSVSRVDNVFGDRHLVARLPDAAPEVSAWDSAPAGLSCVQSAAGRAGYWGSHHCASRPMQWLVPGAIFDDALLHVCCNHPSRFSSASTKCTDET